jgi:hypothetical protein
MIPIQIRERQLDCSSASRVWLTRVLQRSRGDLAVTCRVVAGTRSAQRRSSTRRPEEGTSSSYRSKRAIRASSLTPMCRPGGGPAPRAYRPVGVVVGCAVALAAAAACSSADRTPGASPTRASTSATPPTATAAAPHTATTTHPAPSSTSAATSAPELGPVWPIEPRTIAAASTSATGVPVLTAIRTARHGSYERIVLEFTAPYGAAKVRYVPIVRADPPNKIVPLRGSSFLQIVVHGAVAHYRATPITPYSGPSTVTPGYPTIKQVSISGDFEAVLSFGVGLDRTAGFQVSRLSSPDRLVVDVAETPAWPMWPEDNVAAAQRMQAACDQGHQPWRSDPQRVAEVYGIAVYGWSSPVATPVPDATAYTYRVAQQGSPDYVTVRGVRPFTATSKNSIAEIADSR